MILKLKELKKSNKRVIKAYLFQVLQKLWCLFFYFYCYSLSKVNFCSSKLEKKIHSKTKVKANQAVVVLSHPKGPFLQGKLN